MSRGAGTWAQAKAASVNDQTIDRLRKVRNGCYQAFLRSEAIEIDGVVEALADLRGRLAPTHAFEKLHPPAAGVHARP